MAQYIVNPDYAQDRSSNQERDYARRDKIAAKWTPVASQGGDGNFGIGLQYVRGKVVRIAGCPTFYSIDIYQAIPSAFMLYRLCCTFKPTIDAPGPIDGYKCVWEIALQHASGTTLRLYDYKGGLSVGTCGGPVSKAFERDALALLTYLVGDACVHPYDGVIAGSVA